MSTGLIIASDDLIADVESSLPVMAGDDELDSMDVIAARLKTLIDPRTWVQFDRQYRNDCRAHSGSTGREVLHKEETGEYVQLSREWLYMMCECFDRKFGQDTGVSMQSGIKVLTQLGIPLESLWRYATYYGRIRQREFEAKAEAIREESAKFRLEGQVISNPTWHQVMWILSKGGYVDWGVPYDFRADRDGVVRRYTGNGDGHAMCMYGGFVIGKGELVALNMNSHWQKGQKEVPRKWSLVAQSFYERARRNNRYGIFGVLPKKLAEQVFSWKTGVTGKLASNFSLTS